jgi:hypothetical protein
MLKAQAGKLYDAAKASGLVIRSGAFDDLVNRVQAAVKGAGFHPQIQKDSAAVLDTLDKGRGMSPDLQSVDQLRQIAAGAANSANPNERRISGMIIDHIDNWLGNLKPQDVQSGNPQQAVDLITQARSLWKTQAKGRVLENLMLDATGAPKDPTAIKSGFTTLFKNKGKMAQFSPDEKQAIAIVANGGKVAKALSVLSPRNPFGAVIAGILAIPTHFVGPAITSAIGEGGRMAASAATKRGANAASALVRNGGVRPFDSLAALSAATATGRLLQPVATPTLLDLARSR